MDRYSLNAGGQDVFPKIEDCRSDEMQRYASLLRLCAQVAMSQFNASVSVTTAEAN